MTTQSVPFPLADFEYCWSLAALRITLHPTMMIRIVSSFLPLFFFSSFTSTYAIYVAPQVTPAVCDIENAVFLAS
jgi:hypothetical protein